MIKIIPGLAGAHYAAENHALAIIVDALRASATLCAFCEGGASAISVCSDVESARKVARTLDGALLAGEKDSIKPDDFDLGNSPVEAMKADIEGRELVFTSSNGARMLVAAKGSFKVVAGSVVNAGAIAEEALAAAMRGIEIVLIPAGDGDENSIEDMASCALLADTIGPDIDPAQEALIASLRSEIAQSGLTELFLTSEHGKDLVKLGNEDDVIFAANPDFLRVVPEVSEYYAEGNITIARLTAAPGHTET